MYWSISNYSIVYTPPHHHHHHHCRIAGEGRRVVAPPCPRPTARLQSSPVGRVETFRSWSSHLFRGRPGGRRHVRSGGRLSDTLMLSWRATFAGVSSSSHMPKYRDASTGYTEVRSVLHSTSSFRTRPYHQILSSCPPAITPFAARLRNFSSCYP